MIWRPSISLTTMSWWKTSSSPTPSWMMDGASVARSYSATIVGLRGSLMSMMSTSVNSSLSTSTA